MLNAIWTRMIRLGQFTYHALPWSQLACGMGVGWMLLSIFQQFFSQLGSSRVIVASAWCATGLCWALAWGLPVRQRNNSSGNQPGPAGVHSLWNTYQSSLLAAVLFSLMALSPYIWLGHDVVLAKIPMESTWALGGYVFSWSLLMLGLPVWCAARMAWTSSNRQPAATRSASVPVDSLSSVYLIGLAYGIIISPSFNWGDLYFTSLIAGAAVLAIRVGKDATALKGTVESSTISPDASLLKPPFQTIPGQVSFSTTGVRRQSIDGAGAVVELVSQLVLATVCGGLIVWVTNVIGLLLVTTLLTYSAIVAGTLWGIGFGFRLATTAPENLRQRRLWMLISLFATQLFLTAGFSLVVQRLVSVTGSVSTVWLLQGLRDLFIIALTFPAGCVWSLSTRRNLGPESSESQQSTANRTPSSRLGLGQYGTSVACAFFGGTLVQVGMIPLCGLSLTVYGLLGIIAVVTLLEVCRYVELTRPRFTRLALTGCGLALLCLPFLSHGIRPAFASRLLFSTNVFLADRGGVPQSQLPFLDDARLKLVQGSEHGVTTAWKSAISRYQIRENGIPCGVLSVNRKVAPQPSSEILTSLIPLTLHEQPQNVAVLGAGAGVPFFTCLGALDTRVTLVESDSGLVSVLKQLTQNTEWESLWAEARLSQLQIDPALWVAGGGQKYDVVISNTNQSALVRSSGLFTQEFYRRASRRLAPDGIFCQRFHFHDFGPEPLQTVSATIRSVFTHAMAVEIGPGEMVFLGTNSTSGLIRRGLVDRMQAIYSCEAMASIGWDWSVLLTLGAFDAEHLDAIEAAGRPRINTSKNGRFATQLPREVMRWGNKSQEIAQVLKPNTGKMLNWLDAGSDREDLLRRLAEVRAQQDLLTNYPDQYWAYRSQVRKQVSTRPMSLIQQVKHEDGKGGLHPEDKRRLRYFQQLSKAIHTKSPRELERLEAYLSPYDPLITLFASQELAEIAARVPTTNPAFELEHRFHTMFFTASNDRSIRNALSALRLIVNKPTCVASESERYDALDTVLQALQYRWEAWTMAAVGSAQDMARDVEENIILGEKALTAMSDLAPEAGISVADCEARKRVIERKLLQPLRTYRKQLEPYVARQKLKAQERELDGDLPTEEELKYPGADKE